jgi:L-alanine-DL-glutamate epimerase-like enolase superfamily enzyme
MAHGSASLELIARPLAGLLIGRDPLDTTVLQQQMFHAAIKLGPDGALAAALAALDIALWDLKGKILNQPIHTLLGGAWTTTLPFYASLGGHAQRSVADTLKNIDRWLELQPAGIKIRFDADKTTRDADLPHDVAIAKAVRKHVGDALPLGFDANNGYSVSGAIRVGRVLEDLGYTWFEEPVQSYHTDAMGKVAAALDIAVAAGEQEYTLQGIQRLLDAGVDIVQPDIVKTGGFTGLLDMAALCRAAGADFLPHQTQPAVGTAANLHFLAALPHNHFPAEYNEWPGMQDDVFEQPLNPVHGIFHVPAGPGLGLTLREDVLRQRMTPWK